jgi:hypothetical protein
LRPASYGSSLVRPPHAGVVTIATARRFIAAVSSTSAGTTPRPTAFLSQSVRGPDQEAADVLPSGRENGRACSPQRPRRNQDDSRRLSVTLVDEALVPGHQASPQIPDEPRGPSSAIRADDETRTARNPPSEAAGSQQALAPGSPHQGGAWQASVTHDRLFRRKEAMGGSEVELGRALDSGDREGGPGAGLLTSWSVRLPPGPPHSADGRTKRGRLTPKKATSRSDVCQGPADDALDLRPSPHPAVILRGLALPASDSSTTFTGPVASAAACFAHACPSRVSALPPVALSQVESATTRTGG